MLDLLEKKRRAKARDSLDDYCRYIQIPGAPLVEDTCKLGDSCDNPKCTGHEVSTAFYSVNVEPDKHHTILNKLLEKVGKREACPKTGYKYDNVMVFMPPGSAKSTYGSVAFPTWYMGRNPQKNIITTSYASQLAKKFGRKCRSIASSQEYNELFETGLNTTNRAVDDWSLMNGATYMSGGILSGITGNRADGLLIDDPVKGKEDAESKTMRDKTWDAYLSDLRSRVKPGGWKLIIQTRWHEDDLSGRILPEQWDGESGWIKSRQGDMWYVLCIQAECEREDDPLGRKIGEWLWPKWFTTDYWVAEKRNQGSRNWGALYQQKPKPAEGSIYKRSWFKRYGTAPAKFLRVVFSLDTAYKPEQINDPSVLGLWGETEDGRHYLLYVWKDRVEYPQLKRVLANHYMDYKPHAALIEDKASGQSLIQECRQGITLDAYPRKINVPTIAIEPEGSKLIRAERSSSLVEAGLVYLPEVAPWLTDYENEIFAFPLSTHDDQVDMTSQYLEWANNKSGTLNVIAHGKVRKALEGERPTASTGRRHKPGKYNGY
jgi:predicted phage terminase large subunit-like protein